MGRRLRVVHVIDSLAGSGGAENRLVDEVVALNDRFDQVVVRLFEQDYLAGRLAEAGIPVEGLGFRAAWAGRNWPRAAHRLGARLRKLRPDVVHTSLFAGNLVGQLAARPLGLPVVSTFNRTGDLELLRGLRAGAASRRGRAMHAVGARVARRGDVHYRAVGRYALETNCASLGLPLERATVVPRGVELGEMSPLPRAEIGVPEAVPLVVNVARLAPEKAQHLLVDAFALARPRLEGARLVIVGAAGANQPAVEAAIARHGLGGPDGPVQLVGFRADARAVIAAADVFAFSSLSEGSPGAVVEAMRLGVPVAAFDIRPVAELTGDGDHAWLAPAGSVAALADALVAACHDPDRAERVRAARAWSERFSLAAVAAQLGDLLESRVAAARGRAVPPPAHDAASPGASGPGPAAGSPGPASAAGPGPAASSAPPPGAAHPAGPAAASRPSGPGP